MILQLWAVGVTLLQPFNGHEASLFALISTSEGLARLGRRQEHIDCAL